MKKNLLLLVLVLMIMAGCQETNNRSQDTAGNGAQQSTTPVVDRGVPYSNGPSAPPGEEAGPTAPPPEVSDTTVDQAQAVTTNENIRLTLPRKTE